MDPLVTTGAIAVSLLAAVIVGFRLHGRLPEDHVSGDSKDAVKLAMGRVATMVERTDAGKCFGACRIDPGGGVASKRSRASRRGPSVVRRSAEEVLAWS